MDRPGISRNLLRSFLANPLTTLGLAVLLSILAAVALTPFQTESCLSSPPATNCHGFPAPMR